MYDEGYSLSVKSIREIYQKLIATKFSAWGREDEVRMVRFVDGDISNEDGYILSLPEDAIKSVILGPNIPSAYKEQLLQILQARDIPSKAMLKSGNYRWELKTIYG
ncbi:hypothetical protein I5Q27_00760 [Serratia marcescens]|nr:hypothetical protein [Serratia marcescens]